MPEIYEPRNVTLAIRTGRDTWTKTHGVLHFQADRMVGADNLDVKIGPMGVTGTIYLVTDSIARDSRVLMRIMRQRLVNGKIVEAINFGEVEDTPPRVQAPVQVPVAVETQAA